ncbi:MAG TPA: class II glutamine amidotransferase [Burkholderiales bacterium]|nr:class II glutamine amidotransferase [Burkholderiales bacterium]
MPNLLAISFEGDLAPSFDLRCLAPGRKPPDGWGIGWYPGSEPAATVMKEPAPPHGSIRSELVRAWEHLASSLFLVHIRYATWGPLSDANTQPFCRSYGGRDWLLGHSGSLDHRLVQEEGARFLPIGSTDTELIFCELLGWVAAHNWRSIGEVDLSALHDWFHRLNEHGDSTLAFTDGHDLVVYADRNGNGDVFLWELTPPYDRLALGDSDLEVDLTKRGVKSRKGVIVTSTPLEPSPPVNGAEVAKPAWRKLSPGSMAVIRQGALRTELKPNSTPGTASAELTAGQGALPTEPGAPRVRPPLHLLTRETKPQRLQVEHRTVYRYATPVERSTHLLRLEPAHDLLQSKLSYRIDVSVDGKRTEFEDVFGNRVTRLDIDQPFTELAIVSRALVEVRDTNPLAFRSRLHARTAIPVVWMPWQRHMLQPYLLPPELPETQLLELTDYAMSFVQRNDSDLLETLLDMNLSIFSEYRYVQGVTNLATTPFDVYSTRRGVCQDFANLFICLARLLGVPARYVCGYVYTGPQGQNQARSEASHAWVQFYLPEVGWKGFDPTNGVVTQTDHVRVAVGRAYVDATPTSGTIFVGGGRETLEVEVHCEPAPT